MNKYSPLLGFVDLLLNLAITFCFLFLLSQLLINVNKAQNSAAEREGSYIIEAKWNDGVDADIDLWVKAPNGERSGFRSRDAGTMSLLRDDLGNINDRYVNDKGQEVLNPINREEVTIRTPMTGEYIVNLHYFRKPWEGNPKVTVKVTIKQVKENTTLSERNLEMNAAGQELTAFVIELDSAGSIKKINQPMASRLWVTNGSDTVVP